MIPYLLIITILTLLWICLLYIQHDRGNNYGNCTHKNLYEEQKSDGQVAKMVEFPESLREVDIVAIGLKRIITPTGKSWDEWFDSPDVSEDFMPSREQPADQNC